MSNRSTITHKIALVVDKDDRPIELLLDPVPKEEASRQLPQYTTMFHREFATEDNGRATVRVVREVHTNPEYIDNVIGGCYYLLLRSAQGKDFPEVVARIRNVDVLITLTYELLKDVVWGSDIVLPQWLKAAVRYMMKTMGRKSVFDMAPKNSPRQTIHIKKFDDYFMELP